MIPRNNPLALAWLREQLDRARHVRGTVIRQPMFTLKNDNEYNTDPDQPCDCATFCTGGAHSYEQVYSLGEMTEHQVEVWLRTNALYRYECFCDECDAKRHGMEAA
jgi:hypothetical protein